MKTFAAHVVGGQQERLLSDPLIEDQQNELYSCGWSEVISGVRDMLVNASKDLPFVRLGPFDLLAWQLLWVGGLFIGQRFLENNALGAPTLNLRVPLMPGGTPSLASYAPPSPLVLRLKPAAVVVYAGDTPQVSASSRKEQRL